MKKDILAAITFLVTGLVFFVVQMSGVGDPIFSQESDCAVSEAVFADDVVQSPQILEPVSRDS